jgi:hypothetical protein
MIWNTAVSTLQFFGYTIALIGLTYYSIDWKQVIANITEMWLSLKMAWSSSIPNKEEEELPLTSNV